MAFSRYDRSPKIDLGKMVGTSKYIPVLQQAIKLGLIEVEDVVVSKAQRLDVVAGRTWGDGRYWWIIAACSGIGWGMQVPPGTVLKVPINLGDIESLVG
tara:strand:+ start:2300 stop:2596 length:297 start_codon:yes stop_codon:yes gene_type:complete